MTDFTNGATTPNNGNGNGDGKTDFTGQGVNPNENNGGTGDNQVVLELNGRKFTKEDLVKKISSADDFIETLKSEREQDRKLLQEVQETLKQQVNARDILNKLKQGEGEGNTPNTNTQTVNPDDVAKKVLETLRGDQAAKEQQENWNSVTSKLTQAFGEKTNETVKKVAEENGLTVEEAANLARTKPKMFLKLFPDLEKATSKQDSALVPGNSGNPFRMKQQSENKSSGFSKARTTRDTVSIYLNRLKELS